MTKEQEAIKELKDNGFTVVKTTRQNEVSNKSSKELLFS